MDEDLRASDEVSPPQSVSWTASEYIAHQKGARWYSLLVAAGVVIAIILWFLNHDIVSPLVALFGAAIIGFYGAKQPKSLQYQLDNHGLIIEQRHYALNSFRTFSIANQGAFSTIVLMPMKRFAIPIEIYYAPEDEDAIVAIISSQLPVEEHKRDVIEKLMHRIHF